MQEQLIEFKTGVLAKKKGFKTKKSNCFIWDKVEAKITPFVAQWKVLERGHEIEDSYEFYPKPTQTVLQKWLREEYDIIAMAVPVTEGHHSKWGQEDSVCTHSINDDLLYGAGNPVYNGMIWTKAKYWYLSGFMNTFEKGLEDALYRALESIE